MQGIKSCTALGHGQMMFTKYPNRGDADVDGHNTSEVFVRLCDKHRPAEGSIFTKGRRMWRRRSTRAAEMRWANEWHDATF